MTEPILLTSPLSGFILSSRGLHADADPSLAQWEQAGEALGRGQGAMQWAIGDWLLYGEGRREWGDGYKAAVARFDRKYQTLLNHKWVAKGFEFSRRRENLPWSYHAEVVRLSPADQDRLLDEAAPDGDGRPRLSRSELRERARKIDRPAEKPPTLISLMHKIHDVLTDAAGQCPPEHVEHLQQYVEQLSGEVPEMAEPIGDADDAKPHVARNSGNNECYTPAAIVNAAREALGGLDLDPASCEEANAVVRAERFYAIADDGLSLPWAGRVFLNPPYSTDLISQFIGKLTWHVDAGDVEAAVVLVNNATETGWFADLVALSSAVVFPYGRVRFWKPAGDTGSPLQGQAIAYVGPEPERFLEAFAEIGWGAVLAKSLASSLSPSA
ncbi:MAG: hypothetical protein IT428_29735 [Planctomycetaceae bacterium]|nr:hypothetical protein [Planctomycetaceae bacterium]